MAANKSTDEHLRLQRSSSATVVVPGAKLDPGKLCQKDFTVERHSGREFRNPMLDEVDPQFREEMLKDKREQYIAFDPLLTSDFKLQTNLGLMKAAIRGKLHFNPEETCVGIVTCGGLCPGLNDVVRALTHACLGNYHVKRVYGFRNGFWGLSAAGRDTAIELSPSVVHDIHRHGGTFLGSSRGPQKMSEMVDTLDQLGINILFCVGGDGTQRGAARLAEESSARGKNISVMGIPKTIDNDLAASHRTFGFETAVEQAVVAIRAAHAEASSVRGGIGLVKVMGRDSGFIASQACLSSEQAQICLISENPIDLDTILQLVEQRFAMSTYCVIVIAEGFGQHFWRGSTGQDASGNKVLHDIGAYLSKQLGKYIKSHPRFAKTGAVKYIDPSYLVRGCAANASDAAFCVNLANLAVHEAMAGAGKTGCCMTYWYSNFCVVPTRIAVSLRRVVNLNGLLWRQVREMTQSLLPNDQLRSKARRIAALELRAAENKARTMHAMLSKL